MKRPIEIHNERHNPRVEAHILERLEKIVDRFSDRIGHMEAHVWDENGGKGGEDKVCTIDVKLTPRGQLHVRAKNDNLYAAIDKAVMRAETVITKAVDRAHHGHESRHLEVDPDLILPEV